MSAYLAKLKQLDSEKISHHTPDTVPPKGSKGTFGGFGGTHQAHMGEKIIDVVQDTVDLNIYKNAPNTIPPKPPKGISTNAHSTDTSWRWLLHYADHDVEVTTTPESTLSELLRDFPGALSADPMALPENQVAEGVV